ncbi:bifunctional protein HldE [Novimethylophilus kurashikiensis]|uniref:Bifunctional protein HldE n=1 Tax=Novimethylophilus kurashikiensis TaxID=1825523 RepID=A0A2R5FA24_9PROT|nr:glutamate-cysteine ligase family protein [Novimethylophilus kurashikiensis]GBG15080.1 bifunctional protein HldE [Novimethylophilus kurashikiensis]
MKSPISVFAGYGIELEYMIVDRETLSIQPIADRLFDDAGSLHQEHDRIGCSNELVLHQIELKNEHPTADLEALPIWFMEKIQRINSALNAFNARLMPSAMHPWMNPESETRLWPHRQAEIYQAYERIFDCHRHGHANVQSMQVNLPFADETEFARLHEAVRWALPLIPALAASSPYADGQWSGFMDYRLEVYRTHQQRIPSTAGELIPEPIASPEEYRNNILAPMFKEIAPYDPEGVLQHEWLNVRAAVPRFERSAIEIRLADVQECPQADIAIAAAVIALVKHLYDNTGDWPTADTANLFRILKSTMLDAEQAVIADSVYLRRLGYAGERCMARELWQFLIDQPLSSQSLLQPWGPTLQLILKHGTLARRLRHYIGIKVEHKQLEATYRELCDCLNEGRLFLGRGLG